MDMTKEIQEAWCKSLLLGGCEAVCENFEYLHEMDVAALSKKFLITEYEVKVSRSDFLADRKKRTKFDLYTNGRKDYKWKRGNYFYYICPEGLISENEIPRFAGLIYYKDGVFTQIKKAKRIHSEPVISPEKVLNKMLRLTAQRKYIGCSYLTYLNRKIQERNEQRLKEI